MSKLGTEDHERNAKEFAKRVAAELAEMPADVAALHIEVLTEEISSLDSGLRLQTAKAMASVTVLFSPKLSARIQDPASWLRDSLALVDSRFAQLNLGEVAELLEQRSRTRKRGGITAEKLLAVLASKAGALDIPKGCDETVAYDRLRQHVARGGGRVEVHTG